MRPIARRLVVCLLLWSIAYNIVLPLLPLMASDRGASPFQAGVVQGIGYLGAALFLLPVGWMADRRSRSATVATIWLVGALGTALLALPGSWWVLLPGVFLALAGAAALPALAAIAASSADERGRRRVISMVFAAAPGGLLVGSSLGGFAAQWWGMGSACLLAAGITVAAALILRGGQKEEVLVDKAPGSARAGASPQRDVRKLVAMALLATAAGGGLMLLTLSSGFMTPYLRDVVGLSLGKAGVTNGQLAIGQAFWSALFVVWPGDLGKMVIPGTRVSVGRGTIAAIAVCLAANAAYGMLFPRGQLVWVLVALLLRGAHFTLQPLGMTLVADVTGTEAGLATRFSLMAILMGLATAMAPVLGGAAYQFNPVLPFYIVAAAASLGAGLLLLLFLTGSRVGLSSEQRSA